MDYVERQALFRAHAAAMLASGTAATRTDFRNGGAAEPTQDASTAEAARLQAVIYPSHFLAHQVFMFSLFTACVRKHFGEDLDWDELDAFMERLRRSTPEVSRLKTEALIRVCYGEAGLYFEVPQAEHAASIWAVCRLAVSDRTGEGELSELFDLAEESGRETVQGVFTSQTLRDWPAPTSREAS